MPFCLTLTLTACIPEVTIAPILESLLNITQSLFAGLISSFNVVLSYTLMSATINTNQSIGTNIEYGYTFVHKYVIMYNIKYILITIYNILITILPN